MAYHFAPLHALVVAVGQAAAVLIGMALVMGVIIIVVNWLFPLEY